MSRSTCGNDKTKSIFLLSRPANLDSISKNRTLIQFTTSAYVTNNWRPIVEFHHEHKDKPCFYLVCHLENACVWKTDCLDIFHSRWYLEPFNYLPMTTRWVIIWFISHCFNKIGSIILFQHITKCVVFIVCLSSSKNHVMNLIQWSVKVCIDNVAVTNWCIGWLLHVQESYWRLSNCW